MDHINHIMELRERLARVETRLDHVADAVSRHRLPRGLLERLGVDRQSKLLLIAIGVMWAVTTGRKQIAIKLLGLL